jgi:hypothetical protein
LNKKKNSFGQSSKTFKKASLSFKQWQQVMMMSPGNCLTSSWCLRKQMHQYNKLGTFETNIKNFLFPCQNSNNAALEI